MLVLIPQTINGKPLTKKNLGKLAKKYLPNTEKGYSNIWSGLLDEKNDKPIDKSHWVLMTKDVIPGSKNKSCAQQQIIVSDLVKKTLAAYEVPESLEAIVSILSKYASSGTRLFSEFNYTRCQDKVKGYQLVVGGLASSGIYVHFDYDYGCDDLGGH